MQAISILLFAMTIGAWAQTEVSKLRPERDEQLVKQLEQSAEKIKVFWEGRQVDAGSAPKSPTCLKQIFSVLFSDLKEIQTAGTRVENGQRIGTRHRFMYPLSESVSALNLRVKSVGRNRYALQASNGDQVFHSATLGPTDCLAVDLIQLMERASPKPGGVAPSSEAGR